MNEGVKDKSVTIKSIVVVVVAFFIYKFGSMGISKVVSDDIVFLFLREILLCALALVGAGITGRLYTLNFTSKGFGWGFVYGAWFWLQTGFSLVATAMHGEVEITADGLHVGLFFISVFLIGLGEELLFRGILLNGMLDTFGEDTSKNIRLAVIVSGCVFGALHLFNFLTGAAFTGALTQALVNIPSGMLFGAAYVRCKKNIWPLIIIHAFVDTSGFLTSGILAGTTFAEIISSYGPIAFVMAGIELCLALFLLRNKKLDQLIAEEK